MTNVSFGALHCGIKLRLERQLRAGSGHLTESPRSTSGRKYLLHFGIRCPLPPLCYWTSMLKEAVLTERDNLYASSLTTAPFTGSTQYKARDCPGRKCVEITMKQSTVSNILMGMANAPASGSLQQKPQSKKDKLIILLSKPKGARISSLCKTLNWQNHTVWAAISRLRSRGFAITTVKSTKDGVTIYKIANKPAGGIQT